MVTADGSLARQVERGGFGSAARPGGDLGSSGGAKSIGGLVVAIAEATVFEQILATVVS
jgi:hypothetical protein